MGLEFPPVSPATCEFAENDGGGSLRPRHSAVEMALRELCDLQAQATRLAVTIQSIDLKQSHTFSHAGICDERFVRSILRPDLTGADSFHRIYSLTPRGTCCSPCMRPNWVSSACLYPAYAWHQTFP
jgi:hypothetical protein